RGEFNDETARLSANFDVLSADRNAEYGIWSDKRDQLVADRGYYSDAYNNAVNFSKAGKVTEEFESVEIGEIRQGEQGFYLWVGEKIHLTEGGATSTAEYQWVYCMEPVGSEMQITDYINVKNK
ncbi:MAG: hypothetical protein IJN41_01715, partial [Firmicutes bacterium]|nr:hypothetical protein [Bacillota bacterium]